MKIFEVRGIRDFNGQEWIEQKFYPKKTLKDENRELLRNFMKNVSLVKHTKFSKYAILLNLGLILPTIAAETSVLESASETGAAVQTANVPIQMTQDELHAQSMSAFEAVRTGDLSKLPQLEMMLADPRLNTVARTALENLPNRAGLNSLRKGLDAMDESCVAGTIGSLGTMRDMESLERILDFAACDCHSELIRGSACLALGKLGVPDAVEMLQSLIRDTDLAIARAAADGIFTAAKETSDSAKAAEWFRSVRLAEIDVPTTRIAAQNEVLVTGDESLFQNLLKSSDDADFRGAQIILARTDSSKLLRLAVQSLPNLAPERQIKVLATLGISGKAELTEPLLELLEHSSVSRPALLQALGSLKDSRAFSALLAAFSSDDETIRQAAISAASNLSADDISEKLRDRLISPNTPKTERLAILEVVRKKKLTSLWNEVKHVMTEDSDPEVIALSMNVYARLVDSTPGTIAEFATVFASQGRYPKAVFESAMEIICKKSDKKSETIDVLEKVYAEKPAELVRWIGTVGGKKAAEVLGGYAEKYANDSSETGLAVLDEVTRSLGEWVSPDAAPTLARLIVILPESKFRTRAIRGYLRILRQMGMTPLEKRQMISNAYVFTEGRPEDRARFEEIVPHFNQQFPERKLFNGKDFDGWEMIADVFKIEDGAIVAGNFETGVDRNQFLTTKETFGDFYLRVECKIIDAPNNEKKDGNAGIQFRSVRIPNNHEMIGYQADMTSNGGYWGHLYDESRRNRMLQVPDRELLQKIWKPNNWNRYEIICHGKNVRLFLNGVETVNFTEENAEIPLEGLIGLQIHSGGPACSYYRNIFISTAATSDSRW